MSQFKYKREYIKQLKQIVDPIQLLIQIGQISPSHIRDLYEDIRCPCPIHGGNNPTAFSWKKSTGTWSCYTRGCGGDLISHDVYGFIQTKLGCSFEESVVYLEKLLNINEVTKNQMLQKSEVQSTEKVMKSLRLNQYDNKKVEILDYLPYFHRESFSQMVEYLLTRNYTYKDIELFNFYPAKDPYSLVRLGIPIYDEEKSLVGVSCRLMDTILEYPKTIKLDDGKEAPVPKYRMSRFNKGNILYNLNNAKEHGFNKGLVIVEGQFDVTRLHTYGIKNAVCCMGTTLTMNQIALLYKYCYHITFLIEEGEAAMKGVLQSIKRINPHLIKIAVTKLPSGDADSNRKEVVIETLNNLKELTTKDIIDIKNNQFKYE